MGYYSELAAELQESQKNPRLAEILGITYEELNELEYELISITNADGFAYSYRVEIDIENSPQEIVAKIKNLEGGCQVYVNAIDLEYEDDDYDDSEFNQ